MIKRHHPLPCWQGISAAKQEEKLGPKAVLDNGQEADKIRMVPTWWISVNGKMIANSNFQHPVKLIRRIKTEEELTKKN